jgi:myo-inositol catabolism protein IolC
MPSSALDTGTHGTRETGDAHMDPKARPLYILPFDHRGSFVTAMWGFSGPLSAEQVGRVAGAKQLIYEAALEAVRDGVALDRAAILVDERFGAAILADARKRGLATACPAEKSGQAEFAFEYGEEFAQHIEAMNPTYCKVLVRYNPEGDSQRNERQAARLRRLSEYLHRAGRGFLFELLVPPEPAQLERVANESDAYDLEVRPSLMAAAIRELQDAGVEPDVWKVEGLDRRDDAVEVARAAQRQGRSHIHCIVLGRHGEERRVMHWLEIAASVPEFVGFAVGRSTFWDPLRATLTGRIAKEDAVRTMARSYRHWVDAWQGARAAIGIDR